MEYPLLSRQHDLLAEHTVTVIAAEVFHRQIVDASDGKDCLLSAEYLRSIRKSAV
jgi:hypothetical protein